MLQLLALLLFVYSGTLPWFTVSSCLRRKKWNEHRKGVTRGPMLMITANMWRSSPLVVDNGRGHHDGLALLLELLVGQTCGRNSGI
jgi:hypothetical protein